MRNLKKNSHYSSSNQTWNFEKLKNSEKNPKILGVDTTWDFGTPHDPPTRDIYFAPKNPLENEIWGKNAKNLTPKFSKMGGPPPPTLVCLETSRQGQ